jgi:superfamily I DNA and RNA helicase
MNIDEFQTYITDFFDVCAVFSRDQTALQYSLDLQVLNSWLHNTESLFQKYLKFSLLNNNNQRIRFFTVEQISCVYLNVSSKLG